MNVVSDIDYIVLESEIDTTLALCDYWNKEIVMMEHCSDYTSAIFQESKNNDASDKDMDAATLKKDNKNIFKKIGRAILNIINRLRLVIGSDIVAKKAHKYAKLMGYTDLDDMRDDVHDEIIPSPVDSREFRKIYGQYDDDMFYNVIEKVADDINKDGMPSLSSIEKFNHFMVNSRVSATHFSQKSMKLDYKIKPFDFVIQLEYWLNSKWTKYTHPNGLMKSLNKLEKAIRKRIDELDENVSQEDISIYNTLLRNITSATKAYLNITKGLNTWMDLLIKDAKQNPPKQNHVEEHVSISKKDALAVMELVETLSDIYDPKLLSRKSGETDG